MNFYYQHGTPNETFSSAGAFMDGTPQDPKLWHIDGLSSVQYHYYSTNPLGVYSDPAPAAKIQSDLTCFGPLSVCDASWEHCVVLVGWDNSKYGGRGAWLIRNSWGDGWPDPIHQTRPDYLLPMIPGLKGYAYIPGSAQDYGSDLINGMWIDYPMLYTGPKVWQGTWYYNGGS
jgi:hypothetical protein